MGESMVRPRMGWLPDYPDIRDYGPGHTAIEPMLKKANIPGAAKADLPVSSDLKAWCSPVEDQGSLGSCTANAGVGIIEYFQRRAFGKHVDASRLFLYKTTRRLAHLEGDSGAYLRATMGAKVDGGHAVVAVGYDDKFKIKNNVAGSTATTGAVLIRNSWGAGWGDRGYGWLPYEYILKGLAIDWWSLVKSAWIDTGAFKL